MRRIQILLLISVPYLIECTSSTIPSEKKNDSSIINDKDSLFVSEEELSASYDVFFAPCNVEKSGRVKFATLFNQKRIDSNLIVSMTGINCCKVDFLFSNLPHHTLYDVRNWDFHYEQLIKFKDDKRKCPRVLTHYDRVIIAESVMTCNGNKTQQSTLSIEALRFLNSKILESYPCEIKYTYEKIDSIHALHPEKWDVQR